MGQYKEGYHQQRAARNNHCVHIQCFQFLSKPSYKLLVPKFMWRMKIRIYKFTRNMRGIKMVYRSGLKTSGKSQENIIFMLQRFCYLLCLLSSQMQNLSCLLGYAREPGTLLTEKFYQFQCSVVMVFQNQVRYQNQRL